MKKLSLMLLGALLGLGAAAQGADASREKAQALIDRMTLDEKISLMMDASPAIERLGVPQFNWWSEALHGVARAGTATVLPQAIGMAATFDDDAVGEAFEMVSDEARAKFNGFRKRGGIRRYEGLAFWTPNINIFRDPRWGRGQETYGEDPYLTQRMGVAVVEGLQGPKDAPYMKTLAGAKHFALHSGPEWNRHTFDAKNIDPRDLWETYLPSFKVLVDSGVAQVMCAYNRYEGEPCCSNKKLLTQILRDEWGYDRVIVTDCWAMRDFVVDWGHHTHASEPEAGADAVMSGTDLECGPLFKTLRKAYDQGLIDEKYIDQALLRVLTERFRLGEIDSAATPWDNLTPETTGGGGGPPRRGRGGGGEGVAQR
ncbi:MAG: glycoside hydrolase family 3 protein, partial [Duncaniella sp.]|nr:glycoside hydrolase family 3 protein [Duncaniella sp.]